MMPLKALEKQEQTVPRKSKWEEIVRVRAEIEVGKKPTTTKKKWNVDLVLWKDEQHWQAFNQINQEIERYNSN